MMQLNILDAIATAEHQEFLDSIEYHLQVAQDKWNAAKTGHERNDAMIEWYRLFDMKCSDPKMMICYYCQGQTGTMMRVQMTPSGGYKNWPEIKRICKDCRAQADEHIKARDRHKKAYGLKGL